MSNLRIIYDNAANRATLTASTTAGALVASNLQNDFKSVGWRATGTSATITATWTIAEMVAAVVLPFCNLTPLATIRVRGYTEVADATPVVDSGAVLACPGMPLGTWGWGTLPLGANSYSYNKSPYGRVWLDSLYLVKKLVIDIVDTTNSQGYVEASRLVAGTYWEPEKNADYSASVRPVDNSKHYRNGANDLMTDIGSRNSRINFTLSKMGASDRSALWDILRGSGMSIPVLFSMFPNDDDAGKEQTFQIYGKLADSPTMSLPFFNIASSPLDIEEM